MKILKIIGYVIAALVVIVLILTFTQPTDYTVTRSIVINAPKAVVADQAVKFNNYIKWNPWNDDPNMKNTVEGTDGTVGAKYSWSGNSDVGSGSMEIVNITSDRTDIKLHFIEPMEGEAETSLTFEPADSGVKVTWVMNGHAARPMNALSAFNVMENMIGGKYESGLASLKTLAEKYAADHTIRGFLINEIELLPRTYYGVKSKIKMADISKFYMKNLPLVFAAGTKAGVTGMSSPSGLYYSWDEKSMTAELVAGMAFSGEIKGFEAVPVGGKALHIAFYGPYDKTGDAHYAMDDYLKANNLTSLSPVIEEYVTDPMTEKDPSKLLTNIYYLVK